MHKKNLKYLATKLVADLHERLKLQCGKKQEEYFLIFFYNNFVSPILASKIGAIRDHWGGK
jgi:hypothetical protein